MSRILYWGGAQAVTGVHEERIETGALTEVLNAVAERHGERMRRLLAVSVVLLDGEKIGAEDAMLIESSVVEVLPPYAGG